MTNQSASERPKRSSKLRLKLSEEDLKTLQPMIDAMGKVQILGTVEDGALHVSYLACNAAFLACNAAFKIESR